MSFWPLTCFSYNSIPLLQNTCFRVRLPCVLHICPSSWPSCAGSHGGDSPSLSSHHHMCPLASCCPGPPDIQPSLCHSRGLPQTGLYVKSICIFILQNWEVKSGRHSSEHQLKSDRPGFESWLGCFLPMSPWTHSLTALSFGYLIYKFGENNNTYSIGLLGVLNETVHIEHLAHNLIGCFLLPISK